jgi:hypothetical protein
LASTCVVTGDGLIAWATCCLVIACSTCFCCCWGRSSCPTVHEVALTQVVLGLVTLAKLALSGRPCCYCCCCCCCGVCLCRPLPLPDASCKALVAFLRASATAAAANAAQQPPAAASSSSGPDAAWARGYSLLGHALLLEGLACRAAGRDTAAAALEGLVELTGGSAPWLGAVSSSSWQQQVSELQGRWVIHHVSVDACFLGFKVLGYACCVTSGGCADGRLRMPLLRAGSSGGLQSYLNRCVCACCDGWRPVWLLLR